VIGGRIFSFGAELVEIGIAEPGEAGLHLRNEPTVGLQRGTASRQPLQHFAHLHQLEELAQRRDRQVDPAARLDVDNAFLLELVQGEPQWRLADPELSGETLFEDARAGLDVPALDLVLKQLMHLDGDAVAIDAGDGHRWDD